MNRLIEIRRQELLCRERASLDSERRIFWLAEAEEWEQRALDEIATHFRECNPETTPSHTGVSWNKACPETIFCWTAWRARTA
jgi:hypothetical protein